MDNVYLVQKEYMDDKYDIEGVLLYKLLNLYSWRNLDKTYIVSDIDLVAVLDGYKDKSKLIPVGNLDFIRKSLEVILGKQEVSMKPIEVPEVLRKYTNRRYEILTGKKIKELEYDTSKLFIKDADTLKRWNSLLYKGNSVAHLLEDDTFYIVSDYIDIVSEYRVFVKNDEILACQNYLGDALVFPDADKIREMVISYKEDRKRPRAYTLDVAVSMFMGELMTVPLEIHPFVSCGLYGFYSQDILYMLCDGFEYYKRENGDN